MGIETDRYTKGRPVKECTAALAWQLLAVIDLPVFLWNVFPLHPHEPDRPFPNRSHRARERAASEEMLAELLSLLRPEVIVALGGDAARSSERIAPTLTVRVRHPSYGGQTQFLNAMSDLFKLKAPRHRGRRSVQWPQRVIATSPPIVRRRRDRLDPLGSLAAAEIILSNDTDECATIYFGTHFIGRSV